MKHLTHLVLFTLAVTGLSMESHAADAPIVREVYNCNFNEGKDLSDLMAARDFYLKQMEKAGQKPRDAFVWTPFKADVNFDFLWANNIPDLMTFGREADAFNNSPEGQASQERFDSVATCTSSLAMRRQFFQAPGEFSGDPATPQIIGAFACNYRHGHGSDDLPDLLNHIVRDMDVLNRKDGFVAFASQPMLGGGPNARDVFIYGVQGTAEDWAARSVGLQTGLGGASLNRHFNTILDCTQSLFFGQRVVPPPE